MINYGIMIDDVASSLSFYSNDPSLNLAKFTLHIRNGITNDDDWYNLSLIKFSVSTSICDVTLEEIVSVSGSQQILMNATQAIEID